MTPFTDANGRVWRLKLTIDAIDRVNDIINQGREGPPLDLLEIADADGIFSADVFRSIFVSPRRMKAVLAEAVQWEKGDEEEGRALADGLRDSAIEAAASALVDELSCFFPESQRPVIREMLAIYRDASNRMGELAAGLLKSAMAEKLEGINSLADAAN